jgi:Uma2 family endonuclease
MRHTFQPVLPQERLHIHLDEPLSDDAFWTFCQRNPDLRVEQTPNGTLLLMPPTGGSSGTRNLSIARYLDEWIEKEGGGFGFDSSTMFRLPNGAHRSPDAAWVQRERYRALTPEERDGFVPLAPDFVVELRSPSDNRPTLQDKMNEYIRAGVRLGWLIDPQTETVTIYHADGTNETLDQPETITAKAVVSGFSLPLQRIWNPLGDA